MITLDYSNIGGEDIKYHAKKAIRYITQANIDIQSRRLITEFPGYGVKFIFKLQSHCANMTFPDRSIYNMIFQLVTDKGRESAMN